MADKERAKTKSKQVDHARQCERNNKHEKNKPCSCLYVALLSLHGLLPFRPKCYYVIMLPLCTFRKIR